MQKRRRKFARKSIKAESTERRAGFIRLPVMHPAKMPLIGEAQHAVVKFEGNVHVYAIGGLIGAVKKITCALKPD